MCRARVTLIHCWWECRTVKFTIKSSFQISFVYVCIWACVISKVHIHACVSDSVAQLCPTLRNLMDCSSPGPSVCGILQARILEWVVISFSGRASQPRDWACTCIYLYVYTYIHTHIPFWLTKSYRYLM